MTADSKEKNSPEFHHPRISAHLVGKGNFMLIPLDWYLIDLPAEVKETLSYICMKPESEPITRKECLENELNLITKTAKRHIKILVDRGFLIPAPYLGHSQKLYYELTDPSTWPRKPTGDTKVPGLKPVTSKSPDQGHESPQTRDTKVPGSPTNIKKEKERERRECKKTLSPSPAVESLKSIWNSNCGTLRKCNKETPKRKKAWLARLKDDSDISYWEATIRRMAASKFCCGDSDRGWSADIDFFLKPDTHVKVNEGKYDDKETPVKQTPVKKLLQDSEYNRGY